LPVTIPLKYPIPDLMGASVSYYHDRVSSTQDHDVYTVPADTVAYIFELILACLSTTNAARTYHVYIMDSDDSVIWDISAMIGSYGGFYQLFPFDIPLILTEGQYVRHLGDVNNFIGDLSFRVFEVSI
jgi:hypothetical protein